ncbi:heterokaryon incompatibility protein-domain-containing protein, partial [Clohesyomyces aquaticus]
MGNEEEIREFRKRLLKQLLLRLTQDVGEPFNTLAELNEFEPKLSEEDDDHTKLQTLISRYKDLLELATSKASSSGNLPSLKNINDPLAQTGMPLPPYDEVTLTTGPEDIRLLQLLPGTYDEPIVCNLFQIDSLTLYEYEALSYVWGPNENPSVIYVNDWQLAVTKNLEMALRSLRDENNSRILWIDAICIDQTSILEKTEQVGRMGDIYKAAKKVLVFLGPESETSDSVFQFFEKHHLPIVQAFVELLFRPWFSRIWVRQEYIRAAEVPRLICGRRSIDF